MDKKVLSHCEKRKKSIFEAGFLEDLNPARGTSHKMLEQNNRHEKDAYPGKGVALKERFVFAELPFVFRILLENRKSVLSLK